MVVVCSLVCFFFLLFFLFKEMDSCIVGVFQPLEFHAFFLLVNHAGLNAMLEVTKVVHLSVISGLSC